MTSPLTPTPERAEEVRQVQRRTLAVVLVSQILSGAGLAAGITVGGLLAQQMLGSSALAGLPAATFTLGSALTAYVVGRLTQRWGRRSGLAIGFAAGGVGAIGVVIAAATNSVWLLFVFLFVYGAGTATNLQARYAGTDLAAPERRGAAISVALVATTFGGVAGPNLVSPLGNLARTLALPELAGPFLLAAGAYLAAGAVMFVLLRPDPLLLARTNAGLQGCDDCDGLSVVPKAATGAYVGAAIMVSTQIAMIAVMTMTPVHMRAHLHGLSAIGLVIGVHVGAMYFPSPLTGILVDRVGRIWMATAAAATLLLAGIVAACSPPSSVALLVLALGLLGLGWNFGLIAGTALVVDATVPANRAKTQGTIDVFIALAGASGGAVSGIIMSATSFAALTLTLGALSLLFVPIVLWTRGRSRRAAIAAGNRS